MQKRFDILTLFPDAVDPYLAAGVVGRAHTDQHVTSHTWNIRDFATDTHKSVDDTPYGGGAGMVMTIEPIDRALEAVNKDVPRDKQQVVVLSARGRQFTQDTAKTYAEDERSLTLICGRYEGIDQRVIDHLADEEISVGPYVLSGGELPALTIIDAVTRLIPGVLGNPASLEQESFENWNVNIEHSVEYPQYTKPADYKGWKVPDVLLSGDHAAIKQWRASQSK